jgi:hypothetical protein
MDKEWCDGVVWLLLNHAPLERRVRVSWLERWWPTQSNMVRLLTTDGRFDAAHGGGHQLRRGVEAPPHCAEYDALLARAQATPPPELRPHVNNNAAETAWCDRIIWLMLQYEPALREASIRFITTWRPRPHGTNPIVEKILRADARFDLVDNGRVRLREGTPQPPLLAENTGPMPDTYRHDITDTEHKRRLLPFEKPPKKKRTSNKPKPKPPAPFKPAATGYRAPSTTWTIVLSAENAPFFDAVLTEWRWLWTLSQVCRDFRDVLTPLKTRLMHRMCARDKSERLWKAKANELFALSPTALDTLPRVESVSPMERWRVTHLLRRKDVLALACAKHGPSFEALATAFNARKARRRARSVRAD